MAKVDVLHPDPSKQGTRIDAHRYEAFREALLAVIPDDEDGVAFGELDRLVEPLIPAEILATCSLGWHVTTVKLDLEARGLIARVPGRGPQRLRRVG